MSYANLSQANLEAADLRGAILIGTNPQTALLEDADLTAADYNSRNTEFPQKFDPAKAGMNKYSA